MTNMKTFDEQLLEQLYDMITPSKVEMFERIAPLKMNYLTIVLENIYQEHNASAVLRSCESFGIQSLHVIEKDFNYKVQRDIARGAGRWVNMYNYADTTPTQTCLTELKNGDMRSLQRPHMRMTVPLKPFQLTNQLPLFLALRGKVFLKK